MQSRLNSRRRSLLKASAALIGLPGLALAEAAEWPRRPVRFIVPSRRAAGPTSPPA